MFAGIGSYLALGAFAATTTTVTGTLSASSVKVGTAVYMTGKVSGGTGRSVVLQERTAWNVWRNITGAVPVTAADGSYKIQVSTWWLHTHPYRIYVPPTSTHTAALSVPVSVKVTPTYVPPGSGTSFKYTITSPITRWDPCQTTVGVRVNAARASNPTAAINDVKSAINQLKTASGVRLAYLGTTTLVPQSGGNSNYPTGTNIVVAWATPAQTSMLRAYPGAVGVGTSITSGGWANDNGTSANKIIRGAVAIDSTKSYAYGFGTGKTWGDIVLHELGHTFGLNHVTATDQIMYQSVTAGLARLGAGDLAALYERGARLGCLKQPNFRTSVEPVEEVHTDPYYDLSY